MGWRSTKASMDSGTYEPNVDTGGSFAQGFASSFVPMLNDAVSSYASEQKEKRMLELKESLYRQRPRAASTSTASRKDAADLQEISALATRLGISPSDAAGLFYSHDKDSSQAADTYNEQDRSGLIVGEVTPFSPVQDEIPEEPTDDTSQTDDLSATEPATTVGEEVEVASAPEAASVDGVETAPSALDGFAAAPEEKPAFEPFQVASLGSVADDLSLLSSTRQEDEEDTAVTTVAANIEADLEVAEATGQTATVTYQDMQKSGATGQETRSILKAGTRLPQVYAVPDPSKITTLPEATAAMDVLNARSEKAGGIDDFDRDLRPMLEARIRSLTVLPDLGAMLQNNERDKLQEFYENGYQQFQNTADPAQLEMHRQRAGELLQQSNSMPAIPETVNDLHAMQNRLGSGEFTGVPTEWMEALNTATRTAELQERFGDRLTIDYIMDDSRTPRELNVIKQAATNALGEDHPIVAEINIALGTPVPEATPTIAGTTAANWMSNAAAADALNKPELAEKIRGLGAAYEAAKAADINIASVTEANWMSLQAAAIEVGDTRKAEIIGQLGSVFDQRAASGKLPKLSDVRKENWPSLRGAALAAGETALADSITLLGTEYEAAAASGDTSRVDQLAEVSSVLARANTQISDTNAQAEAYLGAADSAYRLNTILQENRNINYFFGGKIPAAIMSAVGEVSAIRSLVNGNDVTINDALTSVDNFEAKFEADYLSGNISDDARAYAMYKAQETRLAFQLARLQQGPAGVISNQDFESALGQVRGSSNAETFEASIRGLVGAEEVKVRTSLDSLLRNPQIQIAQELQKGLDIDFTAGALRTIEQRASDTGAQQAMSWLKGGTATAPEAATADASTPQTAITVSSPEEARRLGPDVYYRNPEGQLYKTPSATE